MSTVAVSGSASASSGSSKEQLEPGSRSFLVKQGHHSIVCRLDLQGFEGELAVISGRARHVARLHRLLEEHGGDPERWLPVFMSTCQQP